jgi:hypothetical protein
VTFNYSNPKLNPHVNGKITVGSDALGFCEELKCDLLVGSQDHAYSFRNARNREHAVQRLQEFVHCEVSSEATFHRGFVVLALNVPRKSKTISVFSRLVKDICNLN